MNRRTIIGFIILFFALLLLSVASLMYGPVKIPFSQIIKMLFNIEADKSEWIIILNEYRIPKVFAALLAGSALSVSGLQMQTLFRNPLAGPYVLGISAGASLGVALAVLGFSGIMTSGLGSFISSFSLVLAAWMGAGLVFLLILLVSIRIQNILSILILGILFSSAISAVVNVLQYFSSESMLKAFIVWTMGSLGAVTSSQLYLFIPVVAIGITMAFLISNRLNILLLGESYARSLGVNIQNTRILVFISTCILAGTVTAFCGPIGFIGVIVPHLARLVFKTADHRILVPASVLIGASVMLFSDLLTQVPGTSIILPINSVTSLTGIPIIIWILIRDRHNSSFL